TLTHFLRAERTVRVRILDQVRDDVAHLERGGTLVFEQAGDFVHHLQVFAIRHLLHQRLAQAHVHRALDLTHHRGGVDRAAHIVRDPDGRHAHDARLTSCATQRPGPPTIPVSTSTSTCATAALYEYAGEGPTPAPR